MKFSKVLSSLLLGSVISLNAGVIAKKDSWQMAGFGVDTNLSKNEYLKADDFEILWYWDGDWKAYSADETIKQKIIDAGYYGENLKKEKGFWIKARKDLKLPKFTPLGEFIPKTRGWHLLSWAKGYWGVDALLDKYKGTRTLFTYREGKWDYRHKYSQGEHSGELRNINYGEGFWLNNSDDVFLYEGEYSYYGDDYQVSYNEDYMSQTESFANKKFTTDKFFVQFDQNGTVISDDERFNNGKWEARRYYHDKGDYYDGYYNQWMPWEDLQVSVKVNKGNNDYFLNYGMNYDNNTSQSIPSLTRVFHREYKLLENGIKKEISKDTTTYYDEMINVAITDETPNLTIDSSVSTELKRLETLLTTNSSSASTTLASIKTNLQALSSKEAKVALAIVNMVEILDEDIVKSIVNFNGSSYSMDSLFSSSLFPDNYEDLLAFNEAVTAYNTKAQTLLQTLASRLKTSSDSLKDIYSDTSYIFQHEDMKLNYVDIEVFRGAMLGLAFKLQFLSSYDFGSDEWLKTTKEGNLEYTKASVDPVGFLSSNTFFANPNQLALTNAKTYLKDFISTYKNILEQPSYKKEGLEVKTGDIQPRNMKFYLKSVLNNLEGVNSSAVITSDYIDYGYYPDYKVEPKEEQFEIDLNALFDSSKTITIKDFPTFKYDGIVDTQKSKEENEPVDSNGTYVDAVEDTKPTEVNNINNFFKSFKNDMGQRFEGDSLIKELFN